MIRQIGAVDVLYQPPQGPCTPPAEALAEMDAAGVAVAMVSQCKQWSCERQWMCVDTRLEDVVAYTSASIRFAGLAGFNPFDVSESVREMEAARALGFRGAFVNVSNFGLRLSDARYYPLFAKSTELAQPVVVQVSLAEPELVR
jgi:predicted TIM-barrel fold metal-dependent hydrolase